MAVSPAERSYGQLASPGTITQHQAQLRQQSNDLLARARQALAEQNWAVAESLIDRAESLGVAYGQFAAGDTPSKLRAELHRRRPPMAGKPRRGGGLFRPRPTAAPADPFATAASRSASVEPLPPVVHSRPTAPATPVGARAQSDQNLLQARRHLAMGDVRQARLAVQRAKVLNVQYGPLDDNPNRVENLIDKYAQLMAQKKSRAHTESFRRQHANLLMEQAEDLLRWHDYDEAERLAAEAAEMNANFGPYQKNPRELAARIAAARRQAAAQTRIGFRDTHSAAAPAVRAGYVVPATGNPMTPRSAASAVYNPATDRTRNVLAQNQQALAAGVPTPATAPAGSGMALFQQGQAALHAHNTEQALAYFRQAAAHQHELDPVTQQRLQDLLQMLSVPRSTRQASATEPSIIDDAAARQTLLARQVSADVAHQARTAEKMRQTDPKGAVALLEQTRKKVESAGLDQANQDYLLRQLDRALADTQKYIEENQARIELDEQNRDVRDQIEHQQQMQVDLEEKMAMMVQRYNELIREQRYDEAEVVAKRAKELDPNNPFTEQIVLVARTLRREASNRALQDAKERGFWQQLDSVAEASEGFDDRKPYRFGDVKDWETLTKNRAKWLSEGGRDRSEAEIEIQQRLETPILLNFENEPLSSVVDHLGKLAGINVYLDPQGLEQEAVSTDEPITINLQKEVSLKSALALILEPRHLGYVIRDEVLRITSEQYRESDVYVRTYNVADLVVPIPNFTPGSGMGLAAAYHDGISSVSFGAGSGLGMGNAAGLAMLASHDGSPSVGQINASVLAQMTGASTPAAGGAANTPAGFGPGGLGGAALADFDSLISLITSTIQPETWDDVGGPGSIAPFETNLSLVIRQTEEVHEEIADLLEQLRRMQDLQVTIEVRFITLNDNFFERIGVDFDFDINDNIDRPFQVFGRKIPTTNGTTGGGGTTTNNANALQEPLRDTRDVDGGRSVTVGMQQPGVFSADLDIPFTQNSFALAVPQFGGFDATAGAQLGFAILSDIEAFFFINAAQGDRRSNVMQAPKVTLFNGQLASVFDQSSSPFVISVVPVVGDFAAAQQPVIVVLNEGTSLTVQAVVSDDRRFVRLTVVPFFSKIGEVNQFQFEGTETSTESTSAAGIQTTPNDNTKKASNRQTTRTGTSVQLPTFSFVTVTTTVSVPDGGTVLLGGIKRLSEGRNEFGVPMLNKLPYVNRLFKNVGIGRETQSLMMMVTPRIIIQEEEEERLGILAP